jgi:subtilisin family serine protease
MKRIFPKAAVTLWFLMCLTPALSQSTKSYTIIIKDDAVAHTKERFKLNKRMIKHDDAVRATTDDVISKFKSLKTAKKQAVGLPRLTKNGVYSQAINGFTVDMTPEQLIEMQKMPEVELIEPTPIVRTQQSLPALSPATTSTSLWGLDRIDQKLGTNGFYGAPATGSSVHIYVIDTGITYTHNEFIGRIKEGYDFVDSDAIANDCHGHGTHVAGTIAGNTYGVAKNAWIHPLKALSCAGSGNPLPALDWIAKNGVKPAVVNMSLGGGKSTTLNRAVKNLVGRGISVVVAAGNENRDACQVSPASEPTAITVAATDMGDRRAYFSNYGSCVDLFAPGVSILSAWYTGDTSTAMLSGTSMATPHTAGVVALFLERVPTLTPTDVVNRLKEVSTKNVVIDPKSSTKLSLAKNSFFLKTGLRKIYAQQTGGTCPAGSMLETAYPSLCFETCDSAQGYYTSSLMFCGSR